MKIEKIWLVWFQLLWQFEGFIATCGNLEGFVAIPVAIWKAHWQRCRGSQAPPAHPAPSEKPTPETRNDTTMWESNKVSRRPCQNRSANSNGLSSACQCNVLTYESLSAKTKLRPLQWDSEDFFWRNPLCISSCCCLKPVLSSSTSGGLNWCARCIP